MNTTIIVILAFLDTLAEVIEVCYELGAATRKYVLPAMVWSYCVVEHYVVPALSIPQNYLLVRRMRLAGIG